MLGSLTVDKIVKGLTVMVTQLENLKDKKKNENVKINEQIANLDKQVVANDVEISRADKIIGNINSILS